VRILFASTSGEGHLGPLYTLMREGRTLGHSVRIVSSRRAAASLERSGFDFVLGDDPSADEAERVWSRFSSLPRSEASAMIERDWFATLCADALAPTMTSVVESWHPDLVIRETCEYSSAMVCDRMGLAHAQLGVSSAAAEYSVLTTLAAPALDARSPGVSTRILAAPYLTRFPASLDPSPYPLTMRYRASAPVAGAPLPEWPAGEGPLVYLTLGTAVAPATRITLLRRALDAMTRRNLRVLVSTGPGVEPHELGALGATAHAVQWVDQSRVLEVADLVVCHGGSGTTFAALDGGVPLVVVPLFADQPTNARLVVEAGAGVMLGDGSGSADENSAAHESALSRLGDAVDEVLHHPRYRDGARRVQREMREADAPAVLLARLTGRPVR